MCISSAIACPVESWRCLASPANSVGGLRVDFPQIKMGKKKKNHGCSICFFSFGSRVWLPSDAPKIILLLAILNYIPKSLEFAWESRTCPKQRQAGELPRARSPGEQVAKTSTPPGGTVLGLAVSSNVLLPLSVGRNAVTRHTELGILRGVQAWRSGIARVLLLHPNVLML